MAGTELLFLKLPELMARETLIKSQNQKSYEFLYKSASRKFNKLAILEFPFFALNKNSRIISDNELIGISLGKNREYIGDASNDGQYSLIFIL